MLVGCADDKNQYSKGGEYDVTKEVYDDLIKAKFAVPVDVRTEKAVSKNTEQAKTK